MNCKTHRKQGAQNNITDTLYTVLPANVTNSLCRLVQEASTRFPLYIVKVKEQNNRLLDLCTGRTVRLRFGQIRSIEVLAKETGGLPID